MTVFFVIQGHLGKCKLEIALDKKQGYLQISRIVARKVEGDEQGHELWPVGGAAELQILAGDEK